MPVWEGKGVFLDLLKADGDVIIDDATLESLFDLSYHVKHVDTIFKRVFGKAEDLPESPRCLISLYRGWVQPPPTPEKSQMSKRRRNMKARQSAL